MPDPHTLPTLSALLSFLAFMWTFSKAFPRKLTEETTPETEEPAPNWRFLKPISALIVILTIALYAFLQAI